MGDVLLKMHNGLRLAVFPVLDGLPAANTHVVFRLELLPSSFVPLDIETVLDRAAALVDHVAALAPGTPVGIFLDDLLPLVTATHDGNHDHGNDHRRDPAHRRPHLPSAFQEFRNR